ncbi:hypothetical protein FQN57_002208 [Myotisia sp. PD_48]|nr:hypothetical protein FQN57_002208 [Myotisia sp. PD_48]
MQSVYVEMLEQQQTQLVCGLQELYRIIITGEEWPGRPLKKSINGHPLTHDILDGIGCLTQEGLADDLFEENLTLVQQRLLSQGVENMDRVVGSSDSSSSGSHSPGSTSQRLSVGDIFSNDTFVPPSSDFRPYSTSQSSSNPHVSQTSQVLQQIQQQRQQQTRAQEQQFQEAQSQMDTSPQLFYPTHTTAPDMHPYSSWAQLSGNGLDDVPTSLDVLDPSFDLDCLQRTAAQLSRQMPNAGTNLSLPPPQVDFTEDDFNLFLNTNPGPPRV